MARRLAHNSVIHPLWVYRHENDALETFLRIRVESYFQENHVEFECAENNCHFHFGRVPAKAILDTAEHSRLHHKGLVTKIPHRFQKN